MGNSYPQGPQGPYQQGPYQQGGYQQPYPQQGYGPPQYTVPAFVYAGFWWRVLAYIIDVIVVAVPFNLLAGSMGFGLPMMADPERMSPAQLQAYISTLTSYQGISLVVAWLYFAILESSSWQGTVGKKVLGILVTDHNGQRIGFGRATGRYFAKILSAIILLIGFMMVGWTQRKQGLHDMIASTLCVRRQV
jgi:uncharacterized RDD family membrane protein YckC